MLQLNQKKLIMKNNHVNVKSEYQQIIEYINKKASNKIDSIKTKNGIRNEPVVDNIEPKRIKQFFSNFNLQNNEKFILAINNSLKTDINNELLIAKNFYTCSDICGCHRKVFFEFLNYDFTISDEYLNFYKNYIINTTYRNIILELANFKKYNTFINYKNKVKDIIYGIQDNIMIDFIINDFISEDVFKLKALLYNLNTSINEKISIIKIIKFNKSFDNITLSDVDFDTSDVSLINKIDLLFNKIKQKTKPDEDNSELCRVCVYKKNCQININNDVKNNGKDKKISKHDKPKNIKKLHQVIEPVKTKHKFLL